MIEQVNLAVDHGILRKRGTVRLEDELADVVAAILQPDARNKGVRGVHHFVLINLGKRHRTSFPPRRAKCGEIETLRREAPESQNVLRLPQLAAGLKSCPDFETDSRFSVCPH